MAAFTTFTEQALRRYLIMFSKGELLRFAPIEGGIENSNYRIWLTQYDETTEYILTIVEGLTFEEVPFFSKLVSHLSRSGLKVAAPHTTLDGMSSTIFCGKPTFLFPRLAGQHLVTIESTHCFAMGEFTASAHNSLSELKLTRDNPYNVDWMRSALAKSGGLMDPSTSVFLSSVIDEYEEVTAQGLPVGLIHGDLFRDNALFNDNELTGVIDFYHACHDLLVMDLTILINDWCLDVDGSINTNLRDAVMKGYQSVRELTAQELEWLPAMQRISASRFALTRLLSGDPPLKNPDDMIALARSFS
jgi:homoserine kinase type II